MSKIMNRYRRILIALIPIQDMREQVPAYDEILCRRDFNRVNTNKR